MFRFNQVTMELFFSLELETVSFFSRETNGTDPDEVPQLTRAGLRTQARQKVGHVCAAAAAFASQLGFAWKLHHLR